MSTPPAPNPADASPAGPPAAADVISLPLDARCFQCGYLLRGLTQPRCPECGTPFEPKEYFKTYLPMWPILLGLFFLGKAVDFMLGSGAEGILGWGYGLRPFLISLPAVVVAALGAYGFLRRRRWARSVAYLWAAGSLALLLWSLFIYYMANGGFALEADGLLLIWETGVPLGFALAIAILVLLRTGMRRRSLTVEQQGRALPVPGPQADPHKDWKALLVASLLYASLLIPVDDLRHISSALADHDWMVVIALGGLLFVAAAGALGAVVIWLRPCRARVVTAVLAILMSLLRGFASLALPSGWVRNLGIVALLCPSLRAGGVSNLDPISPQPLTAILTAFRVAVEIGLLFLFACLVQRRKRRLAAESSGAVLARRT